MTGPRAEQPEPAGVGDRHLLVLPAGTDPQQVAARLRDRVPEADLAGHGRAAVGRGSAVIGPLGRADAARARQAGHRRAVVYALVAPVQREDPPAPGAADPDGLHRAFPEGLPWQEEGHVLDLGLALARRFGGSVLTASGYRLTPEPDTLVDLTVYSPYALDVDRLLEVVRRVLPTAWAATAGQDWAGPDAPTDDAPTDDAPTDDAPTDDAPTDDALAALHERADRADRAALQAPDELDAYAVAGELGPCGSDGLVEVVAQVPDTEVPALAGQDWAARPFLGYQLRWSPAGEQGPTQAGSAARARGAKVLLALARTLVEVLGVAEVVDADGLRRRP